MTSERVRQALRPCTKGHPAIHEGLLDLVEELVRGHPEPQQRKSQDHGVLERHVVLAERVTHHVDGPGVVDAVDLDDHTPLLPGDIEVVAPVPAAADDLPGRLGEPSLAALAGEVELAERPRTAE